VTIPPGKSRPVSALALVAVVLGFGGVVAGLTGHPALGITLRSSAIVFIGIIALRRPSLMLWTFLAMLAGVEIGLDAPHAAAEMHFAGDLFLRLIRMIVAPLLFATITTGIAAHGQLRSVGRVAIKALIYFEAVTTLGLLIGAVSMNLVGAGWGIALPATLEVTPATAPTMQSWQQIVVNIFPENIAKAVAENQILQVAVFSILFGAALAMLTDTKRVPLVSILQSLADTMFQLVRLIMYLAPIAAGAAMAYTVGSMGLGTLIPLGKLVLTYYGALAAFCLLVLLPILIIFRIPVEAALPLAMERMEEFGVPRWIVSFVIPTGYSFNMDGSSVYLSMAAVFAAQAAGIHLTLTQQITMLATLMLASKGVAGVPRAVLVVLLATASAIHIPAAPILLILGVDTLMDMGRTMMNVIGNCMASAVIARTEGALPRAV